MSQFDIARVVSRGMSIYLLIWGLVELTYLPDRILSLVHDWVPTLLRDTRVSPTAVYLRNLHMLTLGLIVMRTGILLTASAILYRFTPNVARYFLTNENDPTETKPWCDEGMVKDKEEA